MQLTVVAQNLGVGGLYDGDGTPCDRWPALAERINSAADRVDVVLLCEVVDWHRWGHRQLARAAADLGLDAAPLAPSRSGLGTALLYRRDVLGHWVRHNPDFADELHHGFAVTAFDVGLDRPLCFAAVHLTPMGADRAIDEASVIATRGYKYGPYAVLAGDINFPPAAPGSPPPDFTTMQPYNIGSRTLLPDNHDDGPPRPDRRVAATLAHYGYTDVAQVLYQRTGDATLLAATSTDDRIDQAWITKPLTDAIIGYRLLTTPPAASDHHGVAFDLDTNRVYVPERVPDRAVILHDSVEESAR